MIITHKLKPMDLAQKQNTGRVDVVQGDKYSRNIEFTFMYNGSAWQIPDGTTAIVRYKKPDATGGNYDTLPDGSTAYQINGNVLTVCLAPQVCTVPGIVQLSVGLIQGSAEINTFSINIVVQPNPGAIYQSEDYIRLSGAVPNSGWSPNMYLGTDESGNVVVKEETSSAGGATFTPSVSADGTLSWTNNKGLTNPEPVNIKGEDGAFRINVTYSNGVYSADKTFDEIKAAYDAGQQPYVVQTGGTLDSVYTLAYFSVPNGTGQDFVDFERYNIGDDTLETEALRIYSFVTGSGSNVVHRIYEFNVPTDAHINSLIDTKLGVIENGSY